MMILRLALRALNREWRAGDLGVVAFALVIATAGVVSVAAFSDRLHQALQSQGTELLGADLIVHTPYPPAAAWQVAAGQRGLTHAQTVAFRSIIIAGEDTQLVEVKAVQSGYPLRGILRVAARTDLEDTAAVGIPPTGRVWVDAQLLSRLRLQIGDRIDLGTRSFVLDRIITLEPDRGGVAFTMAPRVMMNMDDLDTTGLVQPGSLVHYHWLLAGADSAVAEFRAWLLGHGVAESDLRDLQNAQPRFRVALDRGERFLQLATLVSVLLAGIAIARSARHYAQRQWDNAAIMRCFGATQRDISTIYIIQLISLALAASVLGVTIGYVAQLILVKLLPGLVAGALPLPSWRPAAIGIAVGAVTLLGFGLPPILRLRHVPPLRVIRRELGVVPARARMVYGLALVCLAALVAWIARDLKLALWVIGATLVTLLVLSVICRLLLRLLSRGQRQVKLTWRFGLANLVRHAESSTSQIVSLGVGVMAMLLLTTVRSDLWDQWQTTLPADTPNHFLINIQNDQLGQVEAFFRERQLPPLRLTPIVRARLISINGSGVDPQNFAPGFARRVVQRAANLSWTEKPYTDNKIIAGEWWSPAQFAHGLLSVEQGYADALGLKLGDALVYRIAETEVSVVIANLRTVSWDSFRPNFFLLVPPELISELPASYITSLYLSREQNDVLKQLIRKFPNITDIDVDALLRQVQRVLDRVNQALEFIFLFTLAAGLVVLWAALNTSRAERRQEIAVLRALGVRSRQLRLGLLTEFAVLGLLAGIVGGLAATLVGYGFAEFLFDIPYRSGLTSYVIGVLVTAVVVMASGALATRSDINTSPWQSLRNSL